nr:hypothetical protein [Tanacetum cinerariifolium]
MTHLVTSLTPDSANSCVMQGASCTQRKVSMVLFVLPYVLLLVVIVVTVVIIMVISVVVVVAIVGVVVVVVGSSVSSINKLSLVIVGSFSCYWSSTCLVDLTGDEDHFDEDEATGMGDSTRVLVSLGEKTSMFKRYLVKSFEESEEMLPGEAKK